MAFPPQFLDDLRNRVSLISVVGRRVKLVRKGREHHGLCPFHNEKTASFTVNEDKGFFHCFGCGAHGDSIGFEMRAGHLSFTEAVEKLAAEAGIEVPKATPEERVREAQRASQHDALEAACVFFEKHLRGPAGRDGFAYLKNRGLSDDTIARFRLGFAPDSREALKSALMTKECPESLLIEAGLLKKPEGGGGTYDYFRGRVMFPITDRRGRVIGFGARTLGDGQPKYLNSPDTPLFHKGATLYGLAHARELARQTETVVVVEGYMDVIALHQAGFAYAVAPLGTAVTEQQIEELWRLAPEPILCLDGDKAGQRAMARALERAFPILKPGLSLRFATLPAPEDPDSLIKARGPAAMKAVLDAAQPMIEVAWRLATEGRALDTPERRAALEKDLNDKAFAIADETVKWQYLAAFRQKAKESFRPPPRQWVKQGAKGGGRFGAPPQAPLKGPDGMLPGAGRPQPPQATNITQEWMMLTLVLDHPRLMDSIGERLGETTFADKALDNLRRGILKHLGAARDLDADGLAAHLRNDGYSQVLDTLLDANERRLRSLRGHPSDEEARVHWEHVYNLYTRKDLLADVSEANAELAEGATAASWSRFEAVKKQQQAASNWDDEPQGSG